MKKLLILMLFPVSIFAQDFTWEPEGIPLDMEGWRPFQPWLGGFANTNPEFVDIDADGDLDLFLGDRFFHIHYFENIGDSSNARFIYRPGMFDTLYTTSYRTSPDPSFCDLDGDEDQDVLLWTGSRDEVYFENIGTPNSAVFRHVTDNLLPDQLYGSGDGDFADIDGDGDFDIIAGNYNGYARLYVNSGTPTNYDFSTPPVLLPGINLGSPSYISLCDIDSDNDYDLFIGIRTGNLYFYRNEGDSLNYNFVFVTDNFADASVHWECAPTFCDIDADGDYDLFCGMELNTSALPYGDVSFHENLGTAANYNFTKITDCYLSFDIGGNCQPFFLDIDADGDLDLVPGRGGWNFPIIRNIGTVDSPAFSFDVFPLVNNLIGGWGMNAFGDLDADGDYDLIVGTGDAWHFFLSLCENIGTPQEPNIVFRESPFLNYFPWDAFPALADIDADGDLDLFVGTLPFSDGVVYYYENVGTPRRMDFQLRSQCYQNIRQESEIRPHFIDYDRDGDYDLFVTGVANEINYYENIGTPQNAQFVLRTEHFVEVEDPAPYVFFCDIDNDGDFDLFAGQYYGGGIKFYRNEEISGVMNKPRFTPLGFALGQNYPNPFNVVTIIPLTLERALPLRVVVYNQLGQRVETVFEGTMPVGRHYFQWDGARFSTGIYMITLETTGVARETKKLILLK